MVALDCWFDSRAALGEALLNEFEEGGLFVQGSHALTSGSPVTIRLGAHGLNVGLFLDGQVQWRRTLSSAGGAHAAGIGVRLLPDQRDKCAFLRRWAGGDVEESGRSEWRFPIDQRAIVTTSLGARTAKIVHGRLRDVSRHGALLAMPGHIAVGTIVTIDVMFPRDAIAATARVVRAGDAFAALRIETLDASEDARWSRLNSIAEEAFEKRLAQGGPSRPPPAGA